jgi:hypothetical protein
MADDYPELKRRLLAMGFPEEEIDDVLEEIRKEDQEAGRNTDNGSAPLAD